MLKVYIHSQVEAPIIPILYHNLGVSKLPSTPFISSALNCMIKPVVEIVSCPEEADYICIPHDWAYVHKKTQYVNEFLEISKRTKKTLIIFATGDNPILPEIKNSIIFLTSQYKNKLKSNEIIIPGYAEDLLKGGELSIQQKSDKPIVGFCGWASYGSLVRRIKSFIKNSKYDLLAFINYNCVAYKQGVFFRHKAIKILSKSMLVKTDFIIRSAYSGNIKSVELSLEQARKEYIDNMHSSNYVLAPKGDGNYSIRFYEALSLGRIPVLIDTNVVLPLEDKINYDSFIVRVPFKEIKNIDRIISDHYKQLDNSSFAEIQKEARIVFENYLRIDVFFNYIFHQLPKI